jgi:type II secretory pathway component GspD/PulD (secretin)
MKSSIALHSAVVLLALFVAAGCGKKPDPQSAVRTAGARTFCSFDPPTPGEKRFPAQAIKFEQAELTQVLNLYAEISGRSVIRAGNLPNIKITFSNQTPMTAVEVLQALDTVLAAQGVAMVFLGTQYVKVVPESQAHMEAGPVVELQPDQLPDSGSYLIYIVKLKKLSGSDVAPALQPFAKLPSSIITIGGGSPSKPPSGASLPNLSTLIGKDQTILILRDYSSNVRRMLQVVEKMEQQ